MLSKLLLKLHWPLISKSQLDLVVTARCQNRAVDNQWNKTPRARHLAGFRNDGDCLYKRTKATLQTSMNHLPTSVTVPDPLPTPQPPPSSR